MKKGYSIVIVLLLAACVLSTAVVVTYVMTDREGPQIIIDESKVKPYSKSQGLDVLKSYVKAVDAKDGDVSSNILVESVYVLSDKDKAKVVYVAKDNDNNISRESYIVPYEPSAEELDMSESVEEAKDDKNATGDDKSAQSTTKSSSEKAAQNSSSLTSSNKSAPKLKLTKNSATISAGSSFMISNYVDDITDDKDSYEVLSRRIIVDGDYSTFTKGTYILDVYCTNTDRVESNHVEFTLKVQ